MIEVKWTRRAKSDLVRLHDFLVVVNPIAAARAAKALGAAPNRLLEHPRLGQRLEEYAPREVRRLIVDRYEIRYEIRESTIHIVRVLHSREDR